MKINPQVNNTSSELSPGPNIYDNEEEDIPLMVVFDFVDGIFEDYANTSKYPYYKRLSALK